MSPSVSAGIHLPLTETSCRRIWLLRMGAHQCPLFLVSVLAALDSCYLQTTESQFLASIPPSDLPNLLTQLGQMPDYSTFKDYIIKYHLSNKIESFGRYTIFAPNNDAIGKYLQKKALSLLDENQIKQHIVLGERLFKNDLHIGMHRETMMGSSYEVGLYLHGGQLYVNDAPINVTNMETKKGVIHGLTKVMEIQKNRCDINDTVIVPGACASFCLSSSNCPLGTTPTFQIKERCNYMVYSSWRPMTQRGCRQICLRTTIVKDCCLGFFSQQCLPCPGKFGKPCMGNGVCLGGIHGTGVCQCGEGFNGTACEMCVNGKYGTSCNQACSCVHGKCSEGTDGDGSCECDVGWRGVHCESEIKDDKCNKTCHTSANCLENPDGTAYCKCAAGFKGNGKICTAVDACETGNGGCSTFAQCKKTSPGNRLCVCNPGYSGDGVICLEINPCLVDNGGCHVNAECTQTGANRSVCNCFKGYSGDGKSCESINPCRINNGGCSPRANCNHTGPGERECACRRTYVGDGVVCRGTIFQELSNNRNTSAFYQKLQYTSVYEIGNVGPYTVFVPNSEALFNERQTSEWTNRGLLPQVMRFHIVACDQLLFKDLAAMTNVTSLQGDSIPITYSQSQNSIILNNNATIMSSDIVHSNGIIHIIDQVLFPPNPVVNNEKLLASHESIKDNLTIIAEANGYSIFLKLLQDFDLLSTINSPLHTPVTLFWLSNNTIKAMPQKQQDYLFSQGNRRTLIDILKYHIIPGRKIFANDLPQQSPMRTLQGNNITVKCGGKGNIGALIINDGPCKIVQRRMQFDNGITYGIDCLLNPTNVGGHCNTMSTIEIWGECMYCYSFRKCPTRFTPMKVKKYCDLPRDYSRRMTGCQEKCGMATWTSECCRGYFGRDCQACPGGAEQPCSSHGICDDGLVGTGKCKCYSDFNGTACELCVPGTYGPECKSCKCSEHGQCDDGVTGSGQCTCDSGWMGTFCDAKSADLPVCSPNCSSNAICEKNNRCVCRPFYEGDGVTCTVMDLCSQNNGNCAQSATCSQSGVKVTCSCQKGYQGDGYVCLPIDVCVDRPNGGCHEHAICTMTGPGENKCDCKDNYIGDGKDCEVRTQTVDRCSEDNGECHVNADCADLHYEDVTVGVFHLRSPKGQSKFTYDEARKACADAEAKLATYNQLSYAQKAGFHLCSAGWLDNTRVAYPAVYSSPDCGSMVVGIMDYGIKVNLNETWDVFCYRVKDVKCTCKEDYVGDGYMCNGNLLQVLASFPMFSRFTSAILRYSNHSEKGQEFVTYLSNKSIQATMFAPYNDVMGENETLSGQDIEYHLLNGSIILYEDFINTSTLQTRIGHPLQVTHHTSVDSPVKKCTNQTCFVEGRSILEWDIYATNGIIHVISRPLRTPPVPLGTMHQGVAVGIFLILLAVVGIIIFVVYKFRKSGKGLLIFQKLRTNENMDVLMLDNPESNCRHKSSTSSLASHSDPTYNVLLGEENQQLVSDNPFE